MMTDGLIRIARRTGPVALLAATCEPARAQNAQPGASHNAASTGSVSKVLAEAWPERSEWLDMDTDVLSDSQLGPNDGWFRGAFAMAYERQRPRRPRADAAEGL
jgi:hypothetical protein